MQTSTTLVRHYDAATAPRGMFKHLEPILGYPGVVWEHRNLVFNFYRRELLGRFRGSMLGSFWVLIQPMFMFLVYFMVFGVLFGQQKWGEPPDPNFAFYLFSGMISFQAVNEGTSNNCGSIVGNANLVKKVAFPSEVLPIPGTLVTIVVYLVGVLVFLLAWGVCQLFGLSTPAIQPGWMLLLLPLTLVVQFAMILGIGLFLANLNVFARDVKMLWQIFTMGWLFLSPVFWMPYIMEGRMGDTLSQVLFHANPVFPLIMAQRITLGATDAVVASGHTVQFGSFWVHMAVASVWSVFFLLLGYALFMSRKHKYADLV
ncbi:MAG: ABC transporter permease [Planctomycetota bacterium]